AKIAPVTNAATAAEFQKRTILNRDIVAPSPNLSIWKRYFRQRFQKCWPPVIGRRYDADLACTAVRLFQITQAAMVVVRPIAAGTFVRLNVELISLLTGQRSARHDLGFRSEDIERRTKKGSRHKTGGQKLDHALPLRFR